MSAAMYTRAAPPSSPELAELAVDLRLDVQGWLALARAALVARHDELAHLLPERRVVPRRGAGEGLELGLDVERLLAAGLTPGVLGVEHLADLLTRLGARRAGG